MLNWDTAGWGSDLMDLLHFTCEATGQQGCLALHLPAAWRGLQDLYAFQQLHDALQQRTLHAVALNGAGRQANWTWCKMHIAVRLLEWALTPRLHAILEPLAAVKLVKQHRHKAVAVGLQKVVTA
jgi:hypothetical protein